MFYYICPTRKTQTMTSADSLLILATRFDDLGDWTVEQQFVLQMGSSYLLAHGIGTPLKKDATTTAAVPEDGKYTLWVRTKNWTAYWSDGPTPGIFQVLMDGKADPETFGTGDKDWHWQKGAEYDLKKGKLTIALHDLMGLDGRCDAILLTKSGEIPGDSLWDYKSLRETLLQLLANDFSRDQRFQFH